MGACEFSFLLACVYAWVCAYVCVSVEVYVCVCVRAMRAYSLFFAVSCFRYAAAVVVERLLDALGWKTLTSKNASCPVFQKPTCFYTSYM